MRAAGIAYEAVKGMPTVTWSDIYEDEHDGLVRVAYLIVGSQQAAEDLVQDTFIRVMGRLEPEDRPGAYLRRSVINACYSWHRRSWREVQTPPENHQPAYHDELEVEMWDALAALPPKRRAVVVMRYYLDMSEAEVAETLGCRVGTVKSTAHRALKDLKRTLER